VCTSDLKPVEYGQVGRALETTFLGWRDGWGGSEELWNMRLRARRTIGDFSRVFSRRWGGHKNFTISELGDRPDELLVKSSLPLTYPKVDFCWMRKGRQKPLRTPGTNRKVWISGALNFATGRLH
jgi:hypothetical protein